MVKKRGRQQGIRRILFWIVLLLAIGAFPAGYRLWSCLFNVSSPQLYYMLIDKDGEHLKLLDGEKIQLHPRTRMKILDLSTNICFNRGVRIASKGIDANAFLYEETPLSDLLPGKDIFARYNFRINVKYYNEDIGCVDMVVEPFVEDWLDKADRTIGSERRLSVLEQALKFKPEENRIRDRLTEEYISAKRWEQAAFMLEKAAEESPGSRDILYDLLNAYEAMSRTDGVISVLRKLAELDPDDKDLRFRLAETLEEFGRLEDAIKEYEWLAGRMKKEELLPVYKRLGFLYTETGRFSEAIQAYLKSVEMDKDDVNIYYNLSFLYEKTGKKDKSDLYLSKALELKAGDTDGRLKLSESLIEEGRLGEAEKYLREVLQARPKSMAALLLSAKIAEMKSDREGLKKIYKRILELEPKNTTVTYNLGLLEYETGNPDKALPYLSTYAKAFPNDSETHAILFDIYRKQNKDDFAYKEARTIAGLKPGETGYYHFFFEYLNSRGRYGELSEVMTDGLKVHPDNIDMRKYLIVAYLKSGKDDLAVEQMEKLLEITPRDIALLLSLARLQEKQENFKKALDAYKKIIDISPGHEEAEEAYLRLRLEVLPHE